MSRALETTPVQEFMQWFGLLGAPLAWAVQLVMGYGVTEARCNVGGARWGVGVDTWEISLMIAAGAVVIFAELCAVALYYLTRHASTRIRKQRTRRMRTNRFVRQIRRAGPNTCVSSSRKISGSCTS